ncbi:molybdopterin synthase catalytic subunit [Methanohalophilus levihalophilus]|uniref:molybdopterin synthase n=1 Tax=Methanohalophilus levihalophilus TaxID=1431282 RepID=UPI001AE9871A|nr:molybdopterin synthase [Methanohalophilus levihalophilus]MBP2029431.1 molybdopterin synthase catalytic subunit [Methanohalophilus levihalophilus]
MKIIAVVGNKNSGKTTFTCRLVEALAGKGKVGTVKLMTDHRFDSPEKDTGKHFDAGAAVTSAISEEGVAFINRGQGLEKALDMLADSGMDFAVVEGAKNTDLPKVVLGNLESEAEVSNVLFTLPPQSDWDLDPVVTAMQNLSEYMTLESLITKVKQNPAFPEAGCIGTFVGVVRENTDGTITTMLDFEKYEHVAEKRMESICSDLKKQDGVIDAVMYHKYGKLMPGDDIVYIVVAASHRQQMFPALRGAIERLKEDVPIWKKEITSEGDFWVHDTH